MDDTNYTSDDHYSIEEFCSLIRGVLANRGVKVVYLLFWLATFLAWPFVAFMSYFMLDATFRSLLDERMRLAITACLTSYPVIISAFLLIGYALSKLTGHNRYYYGFPWLLVIFVFVCWVIDCMG